MVEITAWFTHNSMQFPSVWRFYGFLLAKEHVSLCKGAMLAGTNLGAAVDEERAQLLGSRWMWEATQAMGPSVVF